MKSKAALKMTVDCLMTIFLLILMAYHLTGQLAHEWFGTATFLLFLTHHFLNASWLKGLFRGKYTGFRVLQLTINVLTFIAMIGMMVSAALISRHVFSFLNLSGGLALGRAIHHLCAYWLYVLVAAHLGLHWGIILGMFRKMVGQSVGRIGSMLLRVAAALISGYGVFAFVKHQLPQYMTMRVQFAFFDYEQPAMLFFLDYMAIMGLFVCIAYYAAKRIRHRTINR